MHLSMPLVGNHGYGAQFLVYRRRLSYTCPRLAIIANHPGIHVIVMVSRISLMDISYESIRLESHPSARDKAVTSSFIRVGQSVLSIDPLLTSLSLDQKGRRCDACHVLGTPSVPLLKCSRCAGYWYCGPQCTHVLFFP